MVEQRGQEVTNLLNAGTNELTKLCRMCDVDSINKLDQSSLCAISEELGKAAGVVMVYQGNKE